MGDVSAWATENAVALLAIVIAALGYVRARQADRRAGAAVLKGVVFRIGTFEEALDGEVKVFVKNEGPAVADMVRVVVWEPRTVAWVRRRLPRRVTKVGRLAPGQSWFELASGQVTEDEIDRRIWITWHDSAGHQKVRPKFETNPQAVQE